MLVKVGTPNTQACAVLVISHSHDVSSTCHIETCMFSLVGVPAVFYKSFF